MAWINTRKNKDIGEIKYRAKDEKGNIVFVDDKNDPNVIKWDTEHQAKLVALRLIGRDKYWHGVEQV